MYIDGVKSIARQLQEAMEAKGWSVPDLLEKSGLGCDRSSLYRKLTDEQKLSTEEAQRLAEALGCTLAYVPRRAS